MEPVAGQSITAAAENRPAGFVDIDRMGRGPQNWALPWLGRAPPLNKKNKKNTRRAIDTYAILNNRTKSNRWDSLIM